MKRTKRNETNQNEKKNQPKPNEAKRKVETKRN